LFFIPEEPEEDKRREEQIRKDIEECFGFEVDEDESMLF
jgi:hypothetical protein